MHTKTNLRLPIGPSQLFAGVSGKKTFVHNNRFMESFAASKS